MFEITMVKAWFAVWLRFSAGTYGRFHGIGFFQNQSFALVPFCNAQIVNMA